MPQNGLELANVAVATVAAALMVGLGFLYRPNRATFLWSLAFLLAMVGAYGQVAATATGIDGLRWASVGAVLAAPPFVWSGLRALRGARRHAWIAPLLGVAAATALVLTGGTDAYAWAFRLAYSASAVFSGLTLSELVRRPDRATGTSLPLSLFAGGFVLLATTSLVTGIRMPVIDEDTLLLMRDINLLGTIVCILCAVVTLLFLARGDGGATASTGLAASAFRAAAADRLARAQEAGERSWAVLVVHLDDSEDLRAAAGESGFAAVCARFRSDVRGALPTDADLGMLDPGTAVVLLSRPTSVVRELLTVMLRTISALDRSDAVRVQLSASVGWAGVAEVGYDLGALIDAAVAAAALAGRRGGDRWERATEAGSATASR